MKCPCCGRTIRKLPNPALRLPAERILKKLNQLSNQNFRLVDSNILLITAQLSTGVDEVDVIRMLEMVWKRWKGGKNEEFFRPKTLFKTENFEQYIGALPKANPPKPSVSREVDHEPQPEPIPPPPEWHEAKKRLDQSSTDKDIKGLH